MDTHTTGLSSSPDRPRLGDVVCHSLWPSRRTVVPQMARRGAALIITLFVLLVITGMGLIAGLTDAVTVPSLESAVRARVPRGTEDANLQALRAGIELSEGLRG